MNILAHCIPQMVSYISSITLFISPLFCIFNYYVIYIIIKSYIVLYRDFFTNILYMFLWMINSAVSKVPVYIPCYLISNAYGTCINYLLQFYSVELCAKICMVLLMRCLKCIFYCLIIKRLFRFNRLLQCIIFYMI